MDPRERDLGSATAGVWTTDDARDAGLTTAQVRRRLEWGEWQSVRRGVYCDGGVVPDAVMRASAAVQRAGGSAVAAGRTAARVWGIPLVDDHDPATQPQRGDRKINCCGGPAVPWDAWPERACSQRWSSCCRW